MHLINNSEFISMKSTCEDDDNDDLRLIIRGSVVSLDFFLMTLPVIINGCYNKRLDSNNNMWQQRTTARRGQQVGTHTHTHSLCAN